MQDPTTPDSDARLRCPSCHGSVVAPDPGTQTEVRCPACGSDIHPGGDSTGEWHNLLDRRLGRFELLGVLGQGAFGTVYKARDPDLHRVVALKVPRSGSLGGDQDRARFLREARNAAHLRHPAIVPIHEIGQEDGVPFLVTEFVQGVTLADLLSARTPTLDETARVIAAVADALHYAHGQGVIHRDVKPSNVMIDAAGEPHLMDFGLARREVGEPALSQEGKVLGTPAFMSPEQARGEGDRADARADIYSLGVILYRMLTGELPFRGTTRMLLHQVLHDEPRRPRTLNDNVPRDLETICLKAMDKDPARRYPDALALADDLRRYLRKEPILARPVGPAARAWIWARRRPESAALLAVSLVAALALGGAGVWALSYSRLSGAFQESEQARRRAEQAEQEAVAAGEREKGHQYFRFIALADGSWRDGDVRRTVELLGRCPPEHRRWEWRFLNRLCRSDLLTLAGHTSGVLGVAYSPDGTQLASASDDHSVCLWDAGTGRRLDTLSGHTSGVTSAAYSRDGKRLVTGSGDRTVKVWDLRGRGEPVTLSGHTGRVWSVAFHPDGERVASAGDDTVRVWDVRTGKALHTFRDHAGVVWGVSFDGTGQRLASCDMAGLVKVRKLTGEAPLTLRGHAGVVHCVAFSPDGTRLASAGADRTVRVWDVARGSELFRLDGHAAGVNHVAFSRDGDRLASAGADQSVRVWDVRPAAAQGRHLLTLKGHRAAVHGVSFSADGTRLASAGADRTLKLWDAVVSQESLALSSGTRQTRALAFGHTGWLAAANEDGTVRVWDGAGREVKRFAEHRKGGEVKAVTGLAFDRESGRLATCGWDDAVRVWDLKGGKKPVVLRGHRGGLFCVAFHPGGKRLASGGIDCTVKVWEVDAAREAFTLPAFPGQVSALAFSPDGKWLVVACELQPVKVYEAATGKEVATLEGSSGDVTSVAFSADGARVAASAWGQTVRVWEVAGWRPAHVLYGHTMGVQGVAFSPDGARLASAGSDHLVKVWDLATGSEAITLRGHTNRVSAVAFSPDGERLASAGEGGAVIVWDAGTRRPGGK